MISGKIWNALECFSSPLFCTFAPNGRDRQDKLHWTISKGVCTDLLFNSALKVLKQPGEIVGDFLVKILGIERFSNDINRASKLSRLESTIGF